MAAFCLILTNHFSESWEHIYLGGGAQQQRAHLVCEKAGFLLLTWKGRKRGRKEESKTEGGKNRMKGKEVGEVGGEIATF